MEKGQQIIDLLEEGWIVAWSALRRGDVAVFWATIPPDIRNQVMEYAQGKVVKGVG